MTYDPRGKLPLTGTSPFAVDPTKPMAVAYQDRLTRIAERTADGNLTGRFVDLGYDEATGRVREATSSDGRTVTYTHDLDPATGLTQGNLTQVVGPTGITQTYGYTDPKDPHDLTSLQEGEGTTPWVNLYAEGRVIQQTHGHPSSSSATTFPSAPA